MSSRKAYAVMLFSIPLFWYLAIWITRFPSFLLPPPDLVAQALWTERSDFLYHTGITLLEALIGYLTSNLLAVAFAVSFLYVPWLEALMTPWLVTAKNVPFVTIASILVIVFGDSPLPKVLIVVLICFFPILANLTKGLKSTEPVLVDRMRVLNASKWQIFAKVRWPSALPYFIASQEISFTGSIIGAIVAEWMFARQGLGFLIVRGLMQYRADKVFGVSAICMILTIAAFLGVRAVEKRLFRWQEGMQL